MSYQQEGCATAARPMTPVESAASECDGAQHMLGATIDRLVERLSMVLSPPTNKVGSIEKPSDEPQSLLVSFLRENASRSQSHIRKLEELLDRLTL